VIWHLIKDEGFRDNPPNPAWQDGRPEIDRLLQVYSADRPEVHDVIAGLRAVLDEYDDRVLIGELYLPIERLVTYYGRDLSGAHLPFNFQLLQAAWDARHLHGIIVEYEKALPEGGWPNWVLGNHDRPRIASRVGTEQTRVAAMMQLTLRGTPTLYYGDEIGMEQVPISGEAVHDPWERNEPGLGFGRDPERTPMHWDASAGAGFTAGSPWLPLAPDWRQRNVAAMKDDPASLLSLYRRLIALRNTHPALAIGSFVEIAASGNVLAYERTGGGDAFLVALNLGREAETLALPQGWSGSVILSSAGGRDGDAAAGWLALAPHEGVILSRAGSGDGDIA
jgi:alpha-glucosidase